MIAAMVATSLVFFAPLALAAGGDTGGGMPSSNNSAPQLNFDPAQTYRDGIAALDAQKFKEAARAFRKVLTVAPRDANTNYLMGLARVGGGNIKGSRRYFSKAVKYNPDFIPAHTELGKAYAGTGKQDKSEQQLSWFDDQIQACAETCAEAAELSQGRADIAEALAGGAQQSRLQTPDQNPGRGDQLYMHAIRLINQHKFAEALHELQLAALYIGPHADILNYQGYANRKLGQFQTAKFYYAEALDLNPNHRGANEYLGELYIETGEYGKARRQLAKLETLCEFACAEEEELRQWLYAALD